jgi:uncharacterized protein
MIIDTRIIDDGHTTLSGLTDLESVRADLPPFPENISYTAEIDRVGPSIFVNVSFDGSFNLECSRCLKSFPRLIQGEFRVILKEQTGKPGQAEDDGADFYFDSRHELVDISSAFYDEIMIAIPLMPLCSEECKGIEVVRSEYINIEYSGKTENKKVIDPRWDALKRLKKE